MPKPTFRIRWLGAATALALLAGCATPGPVHLYALAPGRATIHDIALRGQDAARDIPSYVAADEHLTGFAYDPFTDHFFLRLAPGNRIRVVDRPARKIKREFTIAGADVGAGGDLAVNPPDGHVFLVDPTAPSVLETTRFGQAVRRIAVPMASSPVAIACDPEARELLLLGPDRRTVVVTRLNGTLQRSVALAATVLPSLAVDAAAHELYAPLAHEPGIVGVFSAGGALVRRINVAPGETLIDVGPHSFLRVF